MAAIAGHKNRAAESFLAAINLNPKSAEAHASLGIAQLSMGDHDAAIRSLKTVLQIKPEAVVPMQRE